jgi:hypothetical protein
MSFSINESKVEELLKSSGKRYEVSTSIVELAIENYAPAYAVSGTTYDAPSLVTEETRENLMALRRKIEESGTALKGADELDREIEQIRGGKKL